MTEFFAAQGEGAASGLFSWLEKLLKFATVGVALIAGLGLPAVALQMANFGAPINLVNYQDVIHAGILPVGMLAAVGAYCFAVVRLLKRVGLLELHRYGLFLVVLVVPMMSGVLSFVVLWMWGILWVIRWLFNFQISDQHLLMVSTVLMTCALAATFFTEEAKDQTLRAMEAPGGRADDVEEMKIPKGRAARAIRGLQLLFMRIFRRLQSFAAKTLETLQVVFGVLFLFYAMKAVVYIWDPRLGIALRDEYVIGVSLAFLALLLFFPRVTIGYSATAAERAEAARIRDTRVIYFLAVVGYVAVLIGYSLWVYPRLSSGVGGGLPEGVTLWLKQGGPCKRYRGDIDRSKNCKCRLPTACGASIYSSRSRKRGSAY